MCSERALMLWLKVDAALAVPVLSKMMCSSGRCERWLLWSERATVKTRFTSLDLRFLLGLGRSWSQSHHRSRRHLIDKSEAEGLDIKVLLN